MPTNQLYLQSLVPSPIIPVSHLSEDAHDSPMATFKSRSDDTSRVLPHDPSSHDSIASDADLDVPQAAKLPMRQYISTWILVAFACVWVVFTIIVACNCTLDDPIAESLVLATPAQTVLVLSILSQFTIFLMGELVTTVFEALRWAFSSSQSGISVFSFLILGRATGLLGVFGRMCRMDLSKRSGTKALHRLWGAQRLLRNYTRR